MQLKLNQLILPLDYEQGDILSVAAKKMGCKESLIAKTTIIRRSIDARKRHKAPFFSLTVEVELKAPIKLSEKTNKDIEILASKKSLPKTVKINKPRLKPIVVGAGPCGLMAALTLAEQGLSPLLIERGSCVEKRTSEVAHFWGKGELKTEGNVLFGEGGAGLFSDGKLTARSKDKESVRRFLKTLVKCGASEDILIDAEPHIGSNELKKIVPAFRKLIKKNGCEIQFNSRLDKILIEKNQLRGVIVNGKEIETDSCILATGHSARDIYEMLSESGVMLESKSFAVGVRLELPQKYIDDAQWGKFASHPRLSAASFRLTHKKDNQTRACYSFCMCPGGTVIPCASSDDELTTNGMSISKRSGSFGNAAFIVPVDPSDYIDDGKVNSNLLGIEFQRKMEKAGFIAGGSNYSLPAAALSAFLKNNYTNSIPKNRSWNRCKPADLHSILPDFVLNTLLIAIPKMLKLLKGVST